MQSNLEVELNGGGLTDEELAGLAAGEDAEALDVHPPQPVPAAESEDDQPALPENVLQNPVTGALIDLGDIDSLIYGAEDIRQQLEDLRSLQTTIRQHAWKLTEEELQRTGGKRTKTRRLRGKTLTAKLEEGDLYPDQSALKLAWNEHPEIAQRYLKISSIGLQAREVAKLESTTSTDEKFNNFKNLILSALVNGSRGTATLKMEK